MKNFFLAYGEWILGCVALVMLTVLLILAFIGITAAIRSTNFALSGVSQNEQVEFDFKTAKELNLTR